MKIFENGKWNKLKLRVVGDEVTTWLNDHIMVNMKMRSSAPSMVLLLCKYMMGVE
jgi:hypothetical protein